MFIIRNKETKKFPSEYNGEIYFPLSTGSELLNKIAGCYYSKTAEKLERFFDPAHDRCDTFNKDKYEIVEFKWCYPFRIRQSVEGRSIKFSGYGEISFNTDEGTEYVYDDEDKNIMGPDGVAIEVPAYRQHVCLILFEGNASIHYWGRHEEGSSYEDMGIELVYDEEGFPYWEMDSDCGGTDCDGPIEHHRFFISYGSSENDDNSPLINNPNKRGYNRDYYAEQAGY